MKLKQPVYYLQTDKRWKDRPYRTKGENSTIGSAGCGPTSAAMIIATLVDKNVTPVTTCEWSMKKGYKALNQGTYYSYFVPQFAEYGMKCIRLNSSRINRNPNHPVHDEALRLLDDGHYLIAVMGPGNWTSSGHYIVVWKEDGKYHINDSYSKISRRTLGDFNQFRTECRMYWAIDAKPFIKKEDDSMSQEQFDKLMDNYLLKRTKEEPSSWSKEIREWAESAGIISGAIVNGKPEYQYKKLVTKEEVVTMIKKYNEFVEATIKNSKLNNSYRK